MSGSITLVDAHVHVHPGTSADDLLDAAAQNFAAAAARIGTREFHGVLMLAEMPGAQWFEAIARPAPPLRRWTIELLPDEPASVRARSSACVMSIIAGRQIVTAEGIEVLALATRAMIADELSLERTVQHALSADAIVVLPWGAGKWLGPRGRLVAAAIDSDSQRRVFAGDNGGRPALWPEPAVFTAARRRHRPVLPGTDPLPLPGEERRVGSFGFWLQRSVATATPARQLREELLNADENRIRPFGRPQNTLRFLRNQAALRSARRRSQRAA